MAHIERIILDSKPGAEIAYCFRSSQGSIAKPVLVVFVNGLGLPQAGWSAAIDSFTNLRAADDRTIPAVLTYDRYGQGLSTDRDPQDQKAEDPMHGHDCLDATRDLRQLLTQIVGNKMNVEDVDQVTLILVSNSIGAALTRLYAQEYPGTVAGIIFLDSVIANTDFISILPNPDDPGFNVSALPKDITIQTLRQSREGIRKIFHPSVGSREGLSRKNLSTLLPHSDRPKLKGPGGQGPLITVIGHESDTFAIESAKMGQPEALTKAFTNPFWHRYNKGLTSLTEQGRSKGPFQAPGSGHFIQKDNPSLVADELVKMVALIMDA